MIVPPHTRYVLVALLIAAVQRLHRLIAGDWEDREDLAAENARLRADLYVARTALTAVASLVAPLVDRGGISGRRSPGRP
jgi:hypothetical protein